MALTFQTVFFLTHARQPVSDGLAMFQHPKKDFSPRQPCAPSPEPAAASNLADQRAASYHAGEHAQILLASELPLWPSGDLHDSCRHCARPPSA
jgi:hypothetical protein